MEQSGQDIVLTTNDIGKNIFIFHKIAEKFIGKFYRTTTHIKPSDYKNYNFENYLYTFISIVSFSYAGENNKFIGISEDGTITEVTEYFFPQMMIIKLNEYMRFVLQKKM
jgi:hypothetical protein